MPPPAKPPKALSSQHYVCEWLLQGRHHGVDMSTPLLPETIPEIDADPAIFLGWGVGWRVANVHVQQQPGCK